MIDEIRKCMRWLWMASDGIRLRLVVRSLLGLIRVAAGLVFIFVSKQLIDMATGQLPSTPERIWIFCILLVALIFVEIGSGLYGSYLNVQTETKLRNGIRRNVFAHLMTSTWESREKMHSGDVLNRLEEDVRVIADTLCNSLPQLVVTGAQLLAAFVFLCQMSAALGWALVFIMPVFLLFSKIFFKRLRALTKEIRSTDSIVQSTLQESFQHREIIQTMEQSPTVVDKLRLLQQTFYGQVMNRTRFTLFSRGMVSVGFAVGYAVTFIWCIMHLKDGAITFGMMTAFIQLVGQIQRPTVDLTQLIPSFIHSSTSIDRLRELEAIPGEETGNPQMLRGKVGIRFNDVSFHYPEGTVDVLSHFSHDFKPGSRTAIVGETGAGKTTTIRLMLSLLHPQNGYIILYNEVGASVAAAANSRCNMVYVPQGNSLLSGTIRDNLLLGNPQATDEEMLEALHIAAADFVSELSEGLDSICGEQGAGLSEGQAQRIAIARGLLRPASLMLLDEFSSSLDKETEQTLIRRLLDTCPHKTMIFITHREMIVSYCSDVVRLEKR